jgi:hypothetical protein
MSHETDTQKVDTGLMLVFRVNGCIAEMENATAWIKFTAAEAERDTHCIGEWRGNYTEKAEQYQAIYDDAYDRFLVLTGGRSND